MKILISVLIIVFSQFCFAWDENDEASGDSEIVFLKFENCQKMNDQVLAGINQLANGQLSKDQLAKTLETLKTDLRSMQHECFGAGVISEQNNVSHLMIFDDEK